MVEFYQRPSYTRYLIDFIEDTFYPKNVLIVTGARQVGKTTLIQKILQGKPHLFFNLEKESNLVSEIDQCINFKDFEDYLKIKHHFIPSKTILFIDEAQRSEKLGDFVRFMKEEWKKATVILSGSLVNELYRTTQRRPVGRETYLEIWPFSFKEFLIALNQNELVQILSDFKLGQTLSPIKHQLFLNFFNEYMKVGGLPEVIQYYQHKKDYQKRRKDIYKTYEDDFVRYFSLEEVNLFRRCMEAVAVNVGSPSKDTQAIRLDAPGYKKIAGIFSRLEKWKLIIKYEQLGIEPEKNKYHPKRYLYDTGVLTDLRLKGLETLGVENLSNNLLRTPLGGIIENILAHSLKVQFEDNVFGTKLSTQAEVDFIVKHKEVVYPVECKLALKFKKNHLTSLQTYLDRLTTKSCGFLFYGGLPQEKPYHNCYLLPYYLIDELKRLLG